MLIANLNGKKVIAEDMDNRKQNYTCPNCDKKMLLVKPIANIVDHFRHYNIICPHQTEPETIEHLNGKKYLFDLFKDYKPELEKKLTNGQIADVFLKNNNIAIELQCSNISLSEFEKRNKGYKKMGIPVLWIFGTQKYLRADIDKYGYSNHFRLSVIEREYLDKTNNLGICYFSNGSKMELKRIIFDKWLGMVTRYDSFAEFILDKIKDFIVTDDNLFIIPTDKKIDEKVTEYKNSLYEEVQDDISPVRIKSKGRKRYSYSVYLPTEKQIKYLKKLGHSDPESLTKQEASEWISYLTKDSKDRDLYFNQKGGSNEICPVCGKHHNNPNTSFCSSKCFDIQVNNLRWNMTNKLK